MFTDKQTLFTFLMLYFLAGGKRNRAIPILIHRTVVMIDNAVVFHHERFVRIERIIRF